MPDRDPDIELPPPIPVSKNMPQQIGVKERVAVLVWLATSLYFVYVLVF